MSLRGSPTLGIAAASGNVFAYLWMDEAPPSFHGPEWAQALCPRGRGLGLDGLFLHPVAGPLVFVGVVVLVFQTIFTAARPLMDGVTALVAWSGRLLLGALPSGVFRSLMTEGVWSGVGSVLVFLPQILLLFLFLGLLEDSGYLARAALIADRTMAKVGLQGKSFIPLLSAYACAVPAVRAAARTPSPARSVFASFVIWPFSQRSRSPPPSSRRPRKERSIRPTPSRTVRYSRTGSP